MNPSIDITLSQIHVGVFHRVVTLGINGKDLADEFLSKMLHDDSNKFEAVKTRIRTISDYEIYENRRTFRHVGGGIFEFKRPGLRLYAFYDSIDEIGHLILCTNGGTKSNKKEQNSDIAKAKSLKKIYLAAKANPNTTLTIKEN
ncbi:MAG: hypothetical protein KJT03_17550 [Verrucomicrobiae bacterium]|nr:hypothetical protein [Verrucomicrobiae bacterium]